MLHDGQVDSCHVWFQVLISDLRKKDSFPGLLQVLIFNLFNVDNFPVWFQVWIYNQPSTDISWLVTGVDLELEKRWVKEIVVLAGFRY